MAAKEPGLSLQTEIESIVNRWIVDYYLSRALEAFESGQRTEFNGFKHVIDGLLVRSVESNDFILTKIKVFRFLSWINESETADVSSDSATPLEVALKFLPNMGHECNIAKDELENVCSSIKDMIVVNFIKNGEFAKAKETLIKHFPKSMVGKKAIFMGLINQKSKTHDIIQHSDFHQFRKEMLAFCRRLCLFTVPFLHKAAKQLIDVRLTEQEESTSLPDEQEERGPSSSAQVLESCKHKIIPKKRLEAAFRMLALRSDQRTLAALQEELEEEEQDRVDDRVLSLSPSMMETGGQDSEPEGDFQRNSGSPLEASVADNPPQTDAVPLTQSGSLTQLSTPSPRTRKPNTIARLVVEPDSQPNAAPKRSNVQIQQGESPQTNKTTSSSLVTDDEIIQPSRKMRKRRSTHSRDSHSLSLSTDSEDNDPRPQVEVCQVEIHDQPQQSDGRDSTSQGGDQSVDTEEDLRGEGHQPESPVRQTSADKSQEKSRASLSNHDDSENYEIESSMDSLASESPRRPVPRTSSTPRRHSPRDKRPSHKKWNQMVHNAKESKESWSDEETLFPTKNTKSDESCTSPSGQRRKMWSDQETDMLKKGVEKFGEGNWTKIKAYYAFKGRSNVNLKDRWRTLKKLGMVK